MSGAAPGRQDRLGPGLPVHRRLHRARPDRGHDLRRQAGATSTSSTCRSAACRRSTTATTPARVLYDRLIEQYNVQMFISAGNSGPGVNTVGDPSVATQGDERRLVHHRGHVAVELRLRLGRTADNLHPFSSRGPREDGGFKPQSRRARRRRSPRRRCGSRAARSPARTRCRRATRCSTARRWPRRRRPARRRCWSAPPSRPASSTSRSSCARRCNSSARFLDRLRRLRAGQRPDRRRRGLGPAADQHQDRSTSRSSVPVNTVLSGFLATPGVGAGIYDREGVTLGDAYTRDVHLHPHQRRRREPSPTTCPGSATTAPSLGAASIALPLNKPRRRLTVTVNPADDGAHSAILNLDDPATPGIDYQTMNTVVAADAVHRRRTTTRVTKTGTVGRNQTRAATSSTSRPAPRRSRSTLAARAPRRAPARSGSCASTRTASAIDRNTSTDCYIPPRRAAAPAAARLSRTTTQPAGRRLGGHRRGAAHLGRRDRAVHADGVDPRRDRLAEPGRDRLGDDRRAGRPLATR